MQSTEHNAHIIGRLEHNYNVGKIGKLVTSYVLEKLQHTSAVSGVHQYKMLLLIPFSNTQINCFS